MAASDAAQQSAVGANRASRQSPQPQSKRDKKRQLLNDRLSVMTEQFSRDKDRHYREELQKIQIDVNLVGRVDPYVDRPLDDIDREYRELSQASNGANNSAGQRSLLEMAGPTFQDWVHQIEDLVETRDYDMTTQKYEFERKMQIYHNTHSYRLEVAKRERQLLSETLRDRLLNAIQSKKWRLSREKEAIEISDSSALLLHPNQFSLTNPASPGGTHGKRNTRLRREMEELPVLSENKKRKRNAADDDGSPAPVRRALDSANVTPLWQQSDRMRSLRSETGPIFGIDKLFTDKELSMTYNTAALAAYKHQLTRRDAKGNVIPVPEESEPINGEVKEDDEEAAAPAMERQPSHATRSTRGGQNQQNFYDDKILGVEGLANFEILGNLDKMAAQEPRLPPLIHSQYSKAYVKAESNTPAGLGTEDAQHDMAVMNIFKNYQAQNGAGANLDVANGGRGLLKAMATPPRRNKYAAFVQGPRPSAEALAEHLGVPATSNLRDEPTRASSDKFLPGGVAPSSSAGVAMSRQSSLGGVAMSRTGSGRGKRK
ncbi:Sds3-like-domain-containing protein [Xylariaceae sp. FL0804]|nr:Sds3-like-domain-containing protein [Xylariaceae sp. FL0804]